MRFEIDARVRLLSSEDGVPKGTEGIVRGFKHDKNSYMVQFGGYGMHDIPEASVEAAEPVLDLSRSVSPARHDRPSTDTACNVQPQPAEFRERANGGRN